MTQLISVPTFVFPQGKLGDDDYEVPIHVDYYNGTIVLRQEGEYEQPEEIKLSPKMVEKLFKEIKRHRSDAEVLLKR